MIIRYNSILEMRDKALSLGFVSDNKTLGCDDSPRELHWFNNESKAQTIQKCLTGDIALVPQAEKIIEQLESHIDLHRPTWQASPAGVFPSVPDYCMGLPANMRKRCHVSDDSSPINVIVCTSSSAGIASKTIEQRGAAILALVMALGRARPISLQICATLHGISEGESLMLATINTTPLDLATACYALSSAGLDRRITHYLGAKLNGFNGLWPKTYDYNNHGKNFCDVLPIRLGLDPTKTLIVPPTYLTDTLIKNPTAWVNSQIKRFTASLED